MRPLVRRFTLSVGLLLASAAAGAQTVDGQGAFVGKVRSTLDSVPIRFVDVRLYWIDSTKEVTGPLGVKVTDTFVDTARSRIAATDSTGFFAIWRLAPGRYWVHARRIGFGPIEALVVIDSQTVLHDFVMEPIAALLNRVEIREPSSTSLAKRLDHVGFLGRQKFNADGGTFLLATDWERSRPMTVREILSRYGIVNSNVDIVLDWMRLDYADAKDYPAVLIAGVEIYRHSRPVEFNRPRAGPGAFEKGGYERSSRPLVLIWTHIP